MSEWISVDDRLPELVYKGESADVLTITEEGYMFVQRYTAIDKRSGDWWDKVKDSGIVTHWMPLPAPPKGGE